MAELLSIEDAIRTVLERTRTLPSERVPVEEAAGRVLAEPARAATDLPPFASSAMDGFALRAEDTPGTLPVAAAIPAGRPAERPLQAGEAMAIATGGAVPEGADAVVPIEDVVVADNKVDVPNAAEPGGHVRPRGGDVEAGEVVVAAGTRLTPGRIGALTAAGVVEVACGARPRAAVLSTGTELRPPGAALGPGQIYEANSFLLAAALASAGAEVERLPVAADDESVHREALTRALEADVVVTSGGVSVGPHDLVRSIEAELGVDEVFWGVAVKPGKPVSFGVRGRTLVFGLPGNPVSALAGFELFVRPAVLQLQGASDPGPRFLPGRLARVVRRNPARDQLVRARSRVEDDAVALDPVTGQESHMIVRAAGADALVHVPRGEGELEAGAAVRYLAL
ncbi:MAG TPA: gephyrin-like molybdotransferase Glp [Gaiellaceae bacterium]|jgi:molybdopterin molybdotransferase|nr:gephyrin-like molybdotransferase Glp [Gaiellaceae bacterium]